MKQAGVTLILGGARSGKSSYAERLALELDAGAVTYLATGDAKDPEMERRIVLHRSRRPASWGTWEGAPSDLPQAIAEREGVLLLDCLTMYISRLAFDLPSFEGDEELTWEQDEAAILDLVRQVMAPPASESRHLVAVSNEVGLGIVPVSRMGRRFRDMQGRANQIAAAGADNVALMVAGLPLWLKGGPQS